jgi:hypothetical protein
LRSLDAGEVGCGVYASETGLMTWDTGEPQKCSQEIQSLWNAIDPAVWRRVWCRNDPVGRRIMIGIPLTKYWPTAAVFTPASCNRVLAMDYRELNTAYAVKNAPPLHIFS